MAFGILSEDDASVLDRVDDDVFDHPVRSEWAASFLRDPNSLLAVAVDDGAVVGMASGMVYGHPDKALQLFINEVGVASRRLRLGIAKALVGLLLDRGREMRCKEDAQRAVVYTFPMSDEQK